MNPKNNSNEPQTFGEYLKELRLSQSYSQKQVADYLEVSRAQIGHFENNRRIPNLFHFFLLYKLLHFDIDKAADMIRKNNSKQTGEW